MGQSPSSPRRRRVSFDTSRKGGRGGGKKRVVSSRFQAVDNGGTETSDDEYSGTDSGFGEYSDEEDEEEEEQEVRAPRVVPRKMRSGRDTSNLMVSLRLKNTRDFRLDLVRESSTGREEGEPDQDGDVISHGYEYTEGMRKGNILVDSIKRLIAINTQKTASAQREVAARVKHLQDTEQISAKESMLLARKDPLVKHALTRLTLEKKHLASLQSQLTKTTDTIVTMAHAQEQLALTRKKNEVLESFTDIHSEKDLTKIRKDLLATTEEYENALDTTQKLLTDVSNAVTMAITDEELEDEFNELMGITREPAPIPKSVPRSTAAQQQQNEKKKTEEMVASEMRAYLDMAAAPDAPVAPPERMQKRSRVRVAPTDAN